MTRADHSRTNNLNSTWLQVSGSCMSPLIQVGDLVRIVPAAEIGTGDIVVIPGPPPAVHRVVKIVKGEYLLTKGDISLTLDTPTSKDNLIGKVVAIMGKKGRPILIRGRVWNTWNFLMARYSFSCFAFWAWLSKHERLLQICRPFANPLRHIFELPGKVMAGLAAARRG